MLGTSTLSYTAHHAFARLVREPAFTVPAVLTLALGVGANVAVFALVEAVLLRPLPYAEAGDLVTLHHRDQRTGITKEFIALGDFVDLAERQRSLEGLVAYDFFPATLDDPAEPLTVGGLAVGPGMFDLMRLRPALGRALEAADSSEGAAPVILLGHRLWQERYGGDPAVLGRSVKIGSREHTVVGVAPEGFRFPPTADTDVIFPRRLPPTAPAERKSGWLFAIGRMAPGQTPATVTRDLGAVSQAMAEEHPDQNAGSTYYVAPLRDTLVGGTKQALLLLLMAVGLVLLVASANVANLQLARSLSRRREIGLRLALGAGRSRLATMLIAEGLALALVAGLLGVLSAHWGVRALAALIPASVRVPGLDDVHLDPTVLGFALAVGLGSALVFGSLSAFTLRLEKASDVLGSAARVTGGRLVRRASTGLVVAEIALAFVLLLGAGLVLRSFAGLLSVDPGFDTHQVQTLQARLPPNRYDDPQAAAAVWTRMLEALDETPGVDGAGAAAVVPLTGNNWTVPFERADQPVPEGERPPDVGWQVASGGYFRALRIPILAGRAFDARDRPGSEPVVIVSESIERQFFPGESAVGRRIRLGDGAASDQTAGAPTAEIVGVVGDIRRAGLSDSPRADLYFPFEQNPGNQITLFVKHAPRPTLRGRAPATDVPSALTAAPAEILVERLHAIEPSAKVEVSRTLEGIASESVRETRLLLWLLGAFAITALLLATIGIYGVMAYAARLRTREIGTRMALGATRAAILAMVLRQGTVLVVAGLAVGATVGVVAVRSLQSQLFGVSPTDPVTFAGATLLLAASALIACLLPARRAATVEPAKTLTQ